MKKSTVFVTGLISGIGLGGCTLSDADKSADKPNIIFIFADDLGYGDLECYGSTVNRTPNLDQLAQDGIRFTDFYSAGANSSPSRAGLLTGRHPIRMGINNVFGPQSLTGIPTSEIKISQILQQQGYYTGIVGKWHLGHMHEYLPLQNGFDEFFGSLFVHDQASLAYMRGNKVEQLYVNVDSITYTYTQETLRFLDKNKDKRFFLYLPHCMPHVPLGATENFRGKSANGLYGDVIEELDWSVGQVLKKLDELGLDNNTIVVFASDNGPWIIEGPNGGVPTPYTGGKNDYWDGGQRVPAIIRWKDKIRGGQVNTDIATMMDWFPTFANIAGASDAIPTDRIIDGCDITQVLLGTGQRANQEFAYLHYGRLRAFRLEDWKITLPQPEQRGNFWTVDVPAHDTLFFNLRNDSYERNDLKDKYPAEYQATLAKMNIFAETIKEVPPSMVLSNNQGPQLLSQERATAINEAIAKGIEPKSASYVSRTQNGQAGFR